MFRTGFNPARFSRRHFYDPHCYRGSTGGCSEASARPSARRHHVSDGRVSIDRGGAEMVRCAHADDAARRVLQRAPDDNGCGASGDARSAGLNDEVAGLRGHRSDVRRDGTRRRTSAVYDRGQRAGHLADHRAHRRGPAVRRLQCRDGRRGLVQTVVLGHRARRCHISTGRRLLRNHQLSAGRHRERRQPGRAAADAAREIVRRQSPGNDRRVPRLVRRGARHRPRGAVSTPHTAGSAGAARRLCRDRAGCGGVQECCGGRMTRGKKILIGVGVAVILGALAFANVKFKRQEGTVVNVEAVQQRDLQAIVSASGKIQPQHLVNISADTMGRVTNLAVEEGDRVKKDQFLMQIDPRLLASAAQQAQAGLAAAGSQMEQLRVASESAKAALKQAQDAFTRQQQLWKQGLTTREALDMAESQLKMRQSDANSADKQIETQRLRMQQEQASVESAKYSLSKVRIQSPIEGIVTRRNIEEGETVVVGTMNNAGTVLLTIADMSVIEAQVEVDETDIPTVSIGQIAKVTIDAMPGKSFVGKVVEIGNSPIQAAAGASSASQATNFLVKVQIENTIPDVRPGFTCTAEITTATRKNSVSVPIQATTVREVVVDKEGNMVREPTTDKRPRRTSNVEASELKPGQARKELEGVFVVRDNKAEFVPVKTGIAGEKYFEVLNGLKTGDQVIVGPFSSVRELADGAAVKIEAAKRSPVTKT